ncbi:hypothetical protein [uncultured Xanthomonas sp.]|uniref:hypothetical protein n=1 Tax=uncultured Xanthomonas sp. TaxID=152831 RepID=UPI0025E634BA|nr:hypothetical protein [uncultured Xanthomonas sp.]
MPIENHDCRGDAAKDRIVADYHLLAIGRFVIAPGATIKGCCGELSDEQIIFQYTSKNVPKDEGQFSVGQDCADKFLQRIGQAMPERFDPFASLRSGSSATGGSGSTAAGTVAIAWDPLNKELYQAILLWCSLNQQVPKYSTARILAEVVTNPGRRVDNKQVYDFFKVLAMYKKSLADLVHAASSSHKLRTLSFPLLNAMASKNWIGLP